MTTIDDLIRRLEAATGPDRELDAEIACSFDVRPDWARNDKRKMIAWESHPACGVWYVSLSRHGPSVEYLRYTGSIDAALPGEDIVTMYKIPNGFIAEHCEVNPDGTFKCYSAEAKTEPLARRIAALRARAATPSP